MQDKFEGVIKMVYKRHKFGQPEAAAGHPDEEALACFLEGRLSPEEAGRIKEHLLECSGCMEQVMLGLEADAQETKDVPEWLVKTVKDLAPGKDKGSVLEIILRLKAKAVEILNTTGDVLVGQELVPAPVLRSRAIKDFKDEVIILKDFQDIRIEAKIENRQTKAFSLTIVAKEKATQKAIKDLRVTLIKDKVELESYVTDTGKVIFEHVLLGKYSVEIADFGNKLASVILDINR